MRFEGLDLNLLVALDALLSEQNVSVAAERVGLSQPAVSGALARLREYFKDELLVSVSGRRMHLTPQGRRLVVPVRNVLLQIRATITEQAEFIPATSQRCFSIAASDYAIRVVLCEAMRRVAAIAPGLRFNIEALGEDPTARLDRAEIDFLIVPEPFSSPQHPSSLLFEDEYVVVACRDNPDFDQHISLDQYYQSGHIGVHMWKSRHPTLEERFLLVAERQRRIEVMAPAFADVPQMLIGTRRIATLHRRLAEMFASSLPLKLVPAPLAIPKMREMLQWNRLQDEDPGVRWMARQLTAVGAQQRSPAVM